MDKVMINPDKNDENSSVDPSFYKAWNTSSYIIKCAKIMRSSRDFDEGIRKVLLEIKKLTKPDRVYILQVDCYPQRVLYEWTKEGQVSASRIFSKLSAENTSSFSNYVADYNVLITQTETLKDKNPIVYHAMIQNGLKNTLTAPLFDNGVMFGNLCVDNFDASKLVDIKEFMQALSFFVASEIITNRLVKKLNHLSNADLLTGVLNRNALNDKLDELNRDHMSVGILYADINGLKTVNDTKGHSAGDTLIKRSAGTLIQVFDRQYIYRAGGDEFIVIMEGRTRDDFLSRVHELKTILSHTKEFSMALGCEYTEHCTDIEKMIRRADAAMYSDKEEYYKTHKRGRTM